MDLSSSSSIPTKTYTTTTSPSQNQLPKKFDNVEQNNSTGSIQNHGDTAGNQSLYESAIDNSLTNFSFSENANNNSLSNSITSGVIPKGEKSSSDIFSHLNIPGSSSVNDFDTIINGSHKGDNEDARNMCTTSNLNFEAAANNSSTDTNTSQEEVNPKSRLANKTIFKTDNPNFSIIEINANTNRDQDIENAVLVIDTSSDDGDTENSDKKKINSGNSLNSNANPNSTLSNKILINKLPAENGSEKRRRKAESLIRSSKQKLNIDIAEASAAESASPTSVIGDSPVVGNCLQPATKREIKIYDCLEEFEKNLPSTVTVLETPFGSRVYLVGTAHFSEDSQDDVSFVIRNVRPDVVMVELCPSRIPILKLDEKTLLEEAKSFNIAKIRNIIQSHGCINGIFFILLLQMSAQIAKDLGMAPGGEFRRAFEEIHKLPGCMLHLGDRPIRITLHRALRALSLWQTIKLVWRLTSTDTISIEEVEECKQQDLLEKLMQEMAGEFPAFSDVFVKERDLFLCHSLQLAALPHPSSDGAHKPKPVKVVGVVGIGHANGIAKMWGRVDPQTIPDIMEIPPASLSTRICKYTFKYGLIGLTIFGAFKLLKPRFDRFH